MIIALLLVSLAATLAQAAHMSDRAERPDFARALAHTAVLLVVAAAGVFAAAMTDRWAERSNQGSEKLDQGR